jgi:hypothetical protein
MTGGWILDASPFEGKIGKLQIIVVVENRTRDIQKN